MIDNENTWDKLLKIKTTGRDDSNSDQYRYPYEPTPYRVLERLANSGLIGKKDVVLDYGCGKGRVDFYLAYQTKANTIGVEYDERIYQGAIENRKTAVSGARTEFVQMRAEEYRVPGEVNRCYFFNPFSVELLHKVMARMIESYYENPREVFLFFYYPSEVITNVGKAHLLGFGSFDGVKKTKGELYDYLRRTSDKVFLNVDNPHLCAMASERHLQSDPERPYSLVIPYGLEYSGATVLPSSPVYPFLRIELSPSMTLSTNLVGSYNADNVMAALAVGSHFGIAPEDAAAAIAAYVPSNNRSQMTDTGRNTLIVDAYNANPTSMEAALSNFSNVEASEKIALLGDMLELGEDSQTEHVTVIKKALSSGLDMICLVGTEFGQALDSLKDDRLSGETVKWFADSQTLATWLEGQDINGATVLIKGSRGTRMEKTVQSL